MRYGIYYRKCDMETAPLFSNKYQEQGIEDQVQTVCRSFFGKNAEKIDGLNCDGNHYVYRFSVDGEPYLFRADTAGDDDDYMLAEAEIMKVASASGIPVPRVYGCDVTCSIVSCRWQILEWISGASLFELERKKKLNVPVIASQLGKIFRKLHEIRIREFGFIDTEKLKNGKGLCGLCKSYGDYFYCRLEEHLGYLEKHALVPDAYIRRSRSVLYENRKLFQHTEGCLVHRDPAFWNLIGQGDSVRAIVDWDDAVSGDPADDIGLMHCFHDEPFMGLFLNAYGQGDSDFRCRINLHFLRNMIWKMVIRHKKGYFERGSGFFLNLPDSSLTLYEMTLRKIATALEWSER